MSRGKKSEAKDQKTCRNASFFAFLALWVFTMCMFLFSGCGASEANVAADGSETHGEGSGSIADVPVEVEVLGEMTADVLNIGKADCSVFCSGSQVAVIDTGYSDTADDIMEYLDERGIRKIDHLILTHFDKDHVGGAAKLLENYVIGTIYQPDYSGDEEDSKPYRRYRVQIAVKEIHPVTVRSEFSFIMNDVVFTIYPPQKPEYSKDKDNNRSLVTTVRHGDIRMLFAGDAERERMKEILTQVPGISDPGFDLLKVPHHGHIEKNSEEFFRKISPEYAVICAEPKDGGDGPDSEAVELLRKAGARVLITGKGAVHCVSDGENLAVTQ